MKRIVLVEPSIEYEGQVLTYKNEFLENGDIMAGTAGLNAAASIQAWLTNIKKNEKEDTVAAGWVPATTFLCIREEDNYLLGMVDIRHCLNDSLREIGGHIGYSVRRSQWGKGYAKEMLKQALIFCEKLGLEQVLVTCDKTNYASAKVILFNNGILEKEIQHEDERIQHYWISIGNFE